MDARSSPRRISFLADFGDPQVKELLWYLPDEVEKIHQPGDWPEPWPLSAQESTTLVLHRDHLTEPDARKLRALRAQRPDQQVLLCVGPHARYAELSEWANWVHAIIPDAIAPDVLARYLTPWRAGKSNSAGPVHRPKVAIVSGLLEMRRMLLDACGMLGYPTEARSDWDDSLDAPIVLWEIPVLEPDWAKELARSTRDHEVIAMIGVADRVTVSQARDVGVAACLSLPFELDDLDYLLHKLSRELETAQQSPDQAQAQAHTHNHDHDHGGTEAVGLDLAV